LRIVLSYHGDKRLRERGISNADIQDVVARPTLKVNRNDGCVEYVRTTRSDRRLKVVLETKPRTRAAGDGVLVVKQGVTTGMRLELDTKANAAYVRVVDRPVASSRELDSQRVVDYDAKGEIVGSNSSW